MRTEHYCRPAEEWTLEMFDKMQHYLARLCWDNTVSACMAHIPRCEEIMENSCRNRVKLSREC